MTFTLGSRPHHLGDADLVRYLDRQLDRGGTRRTELHLFACAQCAARLEALQAQGHTVSAWLGELDVPVSDEQRALAMAAVQRARFRARPLAAVRAPLAAVAMVALMLTVAFGTPPGRAWVSGAVERLGRIFPGEAKEALPTAAPRAAGATAASDSAAGYADAELAGGAAPTARVPQRARRPVLPPGMSEPVHFSPGGNYVLLRFSSRQRMGAATVWIKNITTASGQVVAGRRGETLHPTSDGLQVRNAPGSRADYSVEVPNRYRFVRVQVGDEPEIVIEVTRARRDWIWTVNLSDSGG